MPFTKEYYKLSKIQEQTKFPNPCLTEYQNILARNSMLNILSGKSVLVQKFIDLLSSVAEMYHVFSNFANEVIGEWE